MCVRGKFGLKLQNSPKLLHIYASLYCDTNGKVNCEKGYSFMFFMALHLSYERMESLPPLTQIPFLCKQFQITTMKPF